MHRFRDIALERSKMVLLGYHSSVFCWDGLRKIFIERSQMAKVPNSVETLPKISIACVGCRNVAYGQTDGRQTDG